MVVPTARSRAREGHRPDPPRPRGLSNETILFQAALTATSDDGTNTTTENLVLRVSPVPENQLLRDTLFESQARLLQVLHEERNLKVPNVRWFESDPKWFDRAVLREDRAGRAGPDQRPDLQRRGMAVRRDTGAAAHRVGGALDELVRINLTPPELVRFLPGGTSGFPEVLEEIRAEYAWACAGGEHPIVDRLWEWLETNVPSSPPIGLSWGDAPSATRCSTTTSGWSS